MTANQNYLWFSGSTGHFFEICILPLKLLKSSAVPSYHPRTTCSSRRRKKRNEESGEGRGGGSSPTQAVTMATVPSCCLLSHSLTLWRKHVCLWAGSKTLTHLDLPEEKGGGGLKKAFYYTRGRCRLLLLPNTFADILLFFFYTFLLFLSCNACLCPSRERHRIVVSNQDGRWKTTNQDVDVSFLTDSILFFPTESRSIRRIFLCSAFTFPNPEV